MDIDEKGISLKDIGLESSATALLPPPGSHMPEPNPNGSESVFAHDAVLEAETIEKSDRSHEREAWHKADALYKNVESWVQRKIITPEHGRKLLLSAMAKGEINGLTDPKTTLYNQAGFVDRLVHQISRIQRTSEMLSMLFIDLEGFKAVNDILGHHTGDMILDMTGAFIKQNIRGDDEAARLGGDEFGISGTEDKNKSEEEANEPFKERLEKVFAEKFETFILAELEKRGLPTNISIGARIGYAEYTPGDDITTFIKKADADMNSKRDPNKTSR